MADHRSLTDLPESEVLTEKMLKAGLWAYEMALADNGIEHPDAFAETNLKIIYSVMRRAAQA
jgi:hypothetical protein